MRRGQLSLWSALLSGILAKYLKHFPTAYSRIFNHEEDPDFYHEDHEDHEDFLKYLFVIFVVFVVKIRVFFVV